jgi:DNA invertase Pin-like site-specific DNA recombinase
MPKGIRREQTNQKAEKTGYVAYYRVSTDKQGESGLGLEAQREAVNQIARNAPVLAEFTEVEIAKKSSASNRPQLLAAIEEAKKRTATLLIAKLDRLARNVYFISGLMESGVDFVAADMPQANRLTVHIMAAFAEHEARAISDRTTAALGALRARGVKLGNPRWAESIGKAREARIRQPDSPSKYRKLYTCAAQLHCRLLCQECLVRQEAICRSLSISGKYWPPKHHYEEAMGSKGSGRPRGFWTLATRR